MRQATAAAKVLLVDAKSERLETLANAFTIAGYQVVAARSGVEAVAMLERERPDAIVSAARFSDIDAYQLYLRVRADPTTMDTPFLLLAGRDRPTALVASEAGVELVLSGDVALDVVVSRVAELVESAEAGAPPIRRIESASARRVAEPLWAAVDSAGPRHAPASGTASFQGSLGVMDLAEVTQAIALGGKTGVLSLTLTTGQGAMLFDVGRLVHASFGVRTGAAAFAALIRASQGEVDASFRFDQRERGELAGQPRTIAQSVDQLLLSIAADIDEGGVAEGPDQVTAAIEKEG